MVDLPTWKDFIDSGCFDGLEKRTLVKGDFVMTREDDRNKRIEDIDMNKGKVMVNDGKKIYECDIDDVRHSSDVSQSYLNYFGLKAGDIVEGKNSLRLRGITNWHIQR